MGVSEVSNGRRAVFLDRDGVLNRAVVRNGKPYPPMGLHELEIIAGAAEALRRLKNAGFVLIGVTNQPDVARGTQKREIVDAINTKILAELPLAEILICFHDDKDKCHCRKPFPGLLIQASKHHGIDLKKSYMIGDRWRDIECAHNAGCKAILIDCGYAEKGPTQPPEYTTKLLMDAVEWIIGDNQS